MKIKPNDFRRVKAIPYLLGEDRRIRIAEHAQAEPGERFVEHEDSLGNILLVRECNIDAGTDS